MTKTAMTLNQMADTFETAMPADSTGIFPAAVNFNDGSSMTLDEYYVTCRAFSRTPKSYANDNYRKMHEERMALIAKIEGR